MTPTARSTHISVRSFICRGPLAHPFTCLVRSSVELRLGERIPFRAAYQHLGRSSWLPMPICPIIHCGFLGEQTELYDPLSASIPEKDRFVAWLSPDGSKLAVPAHNSADMPPRYVRAGYTKVVGHSLHDLDRFDAIRALQTGNDVASEMNYSEPERRHRREHVPNHDAEDIGKVEI